MWKWAVHSDAWVVHADAWVVYSEHLAIAGKTTVHKVDVPQLRELRRKESAVLEAAAQ